MDIGELLAFGVKNGCSDLHLSAGLPPMIRVDGDIRRINVPALDHKIVHDLVYDIMNDKQRKDYEEFLETDFSFEVPGLARFRVNAFNHNRGAGAVFRTIPSTILTLEDLKALVARATLLLTNDTGPRHIAVALDRPVITLIGPTDPRHTGHLLERQRVLQEDFDCVPCGKKVCPIDHRCMTRLSPGRVVDAAADLLAG